ncbi:hypothetical protein [Winogradskyella sp.]|uniref:hypothetical protein n=1 Tax=Winogradskyella sp. TaxID=1883156 RepID=UPI003F6D1FB7
MNTKVYKGRIWLTSGGHPAEVSCQATSTQQARSIIKGIYGSSFKSFAKQMSTV